MSLTNVNAPHVTDVFEQNGRLYLKTFLIDDTVNLAKWGIKPEFISKHINRFVGRPFILTASRTHPPEFYGAIREDYNDLSGTINRYLQAQEKYRIGTIKKVEPHPPDSPSSIESVTGSELGEHQVNRTRDQKSGWFAYIEITDPAAITAFKGGAIPKYVSPTIFRLKHEERPDETTDFEPLHLAAVDIPAYGFDKAGIRGSCEGDLVSCSKQLQNASAAVEDCGFCIKGTLEGFTQRFSNSSFVNSGVKQASDLTENKQDSVPAPTYSATSAPTTTGDVVRVTTTANTTDSNTKPIEPNKTGEGQPFTKVEAPKVEPTVQEKEEPKKEDHSTKKADSDSKDKDKQTTNTSQVDELTKQVQALLQEVNGLKSYKEGQEKTAQEQKDSARRAKIEDKIPESYANSPEERKKAIDVLMKYDNDEQLDYVLNNFVAPTVNAANNNKSRTVAPKSNKLTDYGSAKASPQSQQQQSVQQASVGFDIAKMRRICAMTDIVGNARYGGA